MKKLNKFLAILFIAISWYGCGIWGMRWCASLDKDISINKAEYYGFSSLGPIVLFAATAKASYRFTARTFGKFYETTGSKCVLNCEPPVEHVQSPPTYYIVCDSQTQMQYDGSQKTTCVGDNTMAQKALSYHCRGKSKATVIAMIGQHYCAIGHSKYAHCVEYHFTCKKS
jgi:hypothetical protein